MNARGRFIYVASWSAYPFGDGLFTPGVVVCASAASSFVTAGGVSAETVVEPGVVSSAVADHDDRDDGVEDGGQEKQCAEDPEGQDSESANAIGFRLCCRCVAGGPGGVDVESVGERGECEGPEEQQ